MPSLQHTPGPWEARTDGQVHIGKRAKNGSLDMLADLETSPVPHSERRANARLMAAAPALVAACRSFIALWPVRPGVDAPKACPDVVWNRVRAAIVDATECNADD